MQCSCNRWWGIGAIASLTLAVSCGGGGTTGSASGGGTGSGGTFKPAVYGVTIDDTSDSASIADSLKSLPTRPMARVVFDPGLLPSDYTSDVTTIHTGADILGQPVDSSEMSLLSKSQHHDRMVQFFDAMHDVDVWEVGNEINGDWAGSPDTVSAKVVDAYDVAKSKGLKTAITLYYNTACTSDSTFEMISWASKWLPDRVKTGVDYLLVSYYPDDCGGTPDWKTTFSQLRTMFPKAKLGFGEIGINAPAAKAAFVRSYYKMSAPVDNFIGRYFYWTFKQDAVPKSKPLWSVFRDVMRP